MVKHHSRHAMLVGVAILIGMTIGTAAQVGADSQWADRLEALDPRIPIDYFELAEDVAQQINADENDQIQRRLAQRLFALAGGLDPSRLGRSSCLALAKIELEDGRRQRLLSLANMLDSYALRPAAGSTSELMARSRPDALAVAEALTAYRAGQGQVTIELLEPPSRADVFNQIAHVLPAGREQFLEEANRYQRGRRPTLSDHDVDRLLKLELALLVNEQRRWSSELLLTGGEALVEADPRRLAETLEVDISRPYFKDGMWRSER